MRKSIITEGIEGQKGDARWTRRGEERGVARSEEEDEGEEKQAKKQEEIFMRAITGGL